MRELPGLNLGTKLTPSLSQASGKVTPEARPAASGVISVPTSTFALSVQEGELLTARVVKALPDNRAVIDISGHTLVAETKVPLMEGQEMLLEARGLQEGKVLLHLLAVGKNPYTGSGPQAQLANLLAQAGLALNQENLVILQYLMAEKAQITGPLLKEIARSLQSMGKFDRETVRAAVFLAVRGLPVNAENIKLAGLILREGGGLGGSLGRVLAQLENLAGTGSTPPVWNDAGEDMLLAERADAAEKSGAAKGSGAPETQPPVVAGQAVISEETHTRRGVSPQEAGINGTGIDKTSIQATKGAGTPNTGANSNETFSTHTNAINITNTNVTSNTNTNTNTNETSTQQINTRGAQENNGANAAQNGRPGTGEPVSVPLNRESSVAKDNIQQTELDRLAEAARNTVSQRAGTQPEQNRQAGRQALPGQLPLTNGAGQATTGLVKPDLKTFLVAVLKSLLTLDLGESSQGGVRLAPGTLEAQLESTGEAWQAKALLGKILTGISHSRQSPEEALSPGVFPQQEAQQQGLQQSEITMPEQAANPEPERQAASRIFSVRTEQLRDILAARELLQISYQKSDDSFIGYFPLPVQVADRFLGADLYVWRRKPKEKGAETEHGAGDYPGSDEGGFHVLFLLNTSGLGSWRIDLVTRGENLSINMAVNQEEASRLVKNRLSELKEKVEAQGYKVNHLNCQVVRNEPGEINGPEQGTLKANSKGNAEGNGKAHSGPFVAGVDLRV